DPLFNGSPLCYSTTRSRRRVAWILREARRRGDVVHRNREQRLVRAVRDAFDRDGPTLTDEIRPTITLERELEAAILVDRGEHVGERRDLRAERVLRQAGANAHLVVLGDGAREVALARENLRLDQHELGEPNHVRMFG